MHERLELTRRKRRDIADRGLSLIEMSECSWEERKRKDPLVRQYLEQRFLPFEHSKTARLSSAEMLQEIVDGRIFGLALVDIHTPPSLREKFSKMQPLILKRTVRREDLGPFMSQYCSDNNTMKTPRTVLAQAYSARNLLLITPLIVWYLEQGLTVKKIHWVREFRSDRIFQPLADKIISIRQAADSDRSLLLQGTMIKLGERIPRASPMSALSVVLFLAGNSVYGKTLENSSQHSNVKLVDEKGLRKIVKRPNFLGSEEVSENLFEASSSKTRHTEEKPLIVGFFILQYSKLRVST